MNIWIFPHDCRVKITVHLADSGPGIAAADIPKVLSPFGQVDEDFDKCRGGAGLGLALAKALAEQHGGTLGLESTPGSGTLVTICLQVEGPATPDLAAQ